MASYLAHLPNLPASRHLSFIHNDGLKTTIIPPLSLSPASLIPPAAKTQAPAPPEPVHRTFGPDTLAHFLHAFHTHYGYPGRQGTHGTTHPNFDLVESRTGYTIYGELPGLKREDVSVETNDLLFTITISGVLKRSVPDEIIYSSAVEELLEREEKEEGSDVDEELHWHVEERHVGRFRRVFHLPIGLEDMGCVKASMQDGLLCISVPKTVAEMYREGISQRRRVDVGGPE